MFRVKLSLVQNEMARLNFVLPKVHENKQEFQWKVLTLFSLCLRYLSSFGVCVCSLCSRSYFRI